MYFHLRALSISEYLSTLKAALGFRFKNNRLFVFCLLIQSIYQEAHYFSPRYFRYLPGDLFQIKQLKRDFDYLYSEYDRIINEHKEAAREGKQTEDFISSYLKKIEVEKEAKDSSFTGSWSVNMGFLLEYFCTFHILCNTPELVISFQ